MLERILRERGERDQADELLLLERAESRVEIMSVDEAADLSEERLVELLANDRRGFQEVLRGFAESIDAGGEECLHGRGKRERIDRRRQTIRAALPDEAPGRRQRLHHLFGEERVPAGALENTSGELAERAVRSKKVLQQLADGFVAKGREHELMVVGSSDPRRSVLGSIVREQQRPRPAHRPRDLSNQLAARGIHPMRVVEKHQPWLAHALQANEASHEGRELAGDPRRGLARGDGIADAEDVEDQRNRVRETRVESAELVRDAPPNRLDPVAVGEPEVAAQEVADGEPRNRRAMGRAMDFVHRHLTGATAPDELEAQPALADAGLTDHADDLPVRLDRAREDTVEPGELRVPSDQAGETAQTRGVEPCA